MIRLAVVLLGCAACFSDGPTPDVPTGATLIAYVPPIKHATNCDLGRQQLYVADVAVGNGAVHVALNQWSPQNSCDNNNSPTATYAVPIYVIPLDAAVPRDLSTEPADFMAGTAQGNLSARVGASRADGVSAWTWGGSGGIEFGGVPPVTLAPIGGPGTSGTPLPTGWVVGGMAGYVTTTSNGGTSDDFNPNFPASNGMQDGTPSSAAYRVTWATPQTYQAIPLGPGDVVYADTVKSGLIANESSLFYASRTGTGQPILLKSLDRETFDRLTTVATISTAAGVLVGMDASDDFLVWSVAPSYAQSFPAPSCVIKKRDLVTGEETVLLDTPVFSCLDAAFDGMHVYFTIFEADHNEGDTFSNVRGVRGVGLGRVSIDGGEPETVRHGINSLYEGPRRVYLHGDDMYAVDSFAVARIAKSALDGKHDF